EAGLYSTAYAIPHLIMMFSTLFTEAWQLSAVTDGGKDMPGREKFFSKVFLSFQGLLFCASAGIILFSKVFMNILAAKSYYDGWIYIPILVIAMTFSCFVTFIGSIYVVEKKSWLSFFTMLLGAVLNLILNALFIPIMGAVGAGVATFISYLLVFVIRAVNTRKFIKMNLYTGKLVVNTLLLIAEAAVMMLQPKLWILYAGAITVVILALNFKALWLSAKKLLVRGA
ncbi:MAG: polysaccharide biosynthesis C-terminal domain-containing protein, partial [Oscillospiraceae bacterium]